MVLRVEVEAVKFLKEEPHRLDALLKRCNTMTDALSTLRRYQTLLFAPIIPRFLCSWRSHVTFPGFSEPAVRLGLLWRPFMLYFVLSPCCLYRQITEGVWKSPEDLSSQSQKRGEDASRSSDRDILNSPPLSLTDLSSSAGLANWMPVSAGDADSSGPEQDVQPSMTFRNRVLDELPGRRPGDKSVSAEVRLVNTTCLYVDHMAASSENQLTVLHFHPAAAASFMPPLCSSACLKLIIRLYFRPQSGTGRRSVPA